LNQYVDGNISFAEYRDIKVKIDKERTSIQSEVDKLDIPDDEEASTISLEDIVLEFKENWKHLTDSEKRKFLLNFVKRIDISVKKAPNNFHWLAMVNNVEFV
ncbi:MAG: hypothetical protein FWE02_07325, partial [Defluviitaleaceae bacterium]|nr:hypothetical protein [Defluviitaleaceae bacterium]